MTNGPRIRFYISDFNGFVESYFCGYDGHGTGQANAEWSYDKDDAQLFADENEAVAVAEVIGGTAEERRFWS